jgi:hypothetical protein
MDFDQQMRNQREREREILFNEMGSQLEMVSLLISGIMHGLKVLMKWARNQRWV